MTNLQPSAGGHRLEHMRFLRGLRTGRRHRNDHVRGEFRNVHQRRLLTGIHRGLRVFRRQSFHVEAVLDRRDGGKTYEFNGTFN